MAPKLTEQAANGTANDEPSRGRLARWQWWAGRAALVAAVVLLAWLLLANVLAPGIAAALETVGWLAVMALFVTLPIWAVLSVIRTVKSAAAGG